MDDPRADIPPGTHIFPQGRTSNQVSGPLFLLRLFPSYRSFGVCWQKSSAVERHCCLNQNAAAAETSISSDIRTLQFVIHIGHCTFPSCDWWHQECDVKCLIMFWIVIVELDFFFLSGMIPLNSFIVCPRS